jgi:gamma-glutamylcyclotransferase (GGCT)/AIG2-like uncharacterized protein YtfP
MMTLPLFCYGTLQSTAVMKRVTGHQRIGEKVVLFDYARYRVRNAVYPGIVSKRGSCVDGILYDDVSDSALKALDEFEGDEYRRQIVDVTRNDGSCRKALVYVVRDDKRDILADEGWDLDTFLNHDIDQFVKSRVHDE